MVALARALRSAGKEVYFILDNPFGEELDPHSMLARSWRGIQVKSPPPLSTAVALQRAAPERERLKAIAAATGAKLVDPFPYLCDERICPSAAPDGELLYKDYDHLSLYGSRTRTRYMGFILGGETSAPGRGDAAP